LIGKTKKQNGQNKYKHRGSKSYKKPEFAFVCRLHPLLNVLRGKPWNSFSFFILFWDLNFIPSFLLPQCSIATSESAKCQDAFQKREDFSLSRPAKPVLAKRAACTRPPAPRHRLLCLILGKNLPWANSGGSSQPATWFSRARITMLWKNGTTDIGKGESHNVENPSKVPLCSCYYSKQVPQPIPQLPSICSMSLKGSHQIKILFDQQLTTSLLVNSLRESEGVLCSNTLFINCSNNQFQGDYCYYKL